MTQLAGAKPIITPMPGTGDAPAPAAPAVDSPEAIEAARVATELANRAPSAPKPADPPVELNLDLPAAAKIDVPSTGIAEFDTVGKMLGERGVTNAAAIMDAFIETGEISLEHKADMIKALGEGVAAMAFNQMEATASKIIEDAKTSSAQSMEYANTKFNGKDAAQTWDEIKAYVRGEGSPFSETDLATMNTMLAAGGLQAELVIDRVHQAYLKDPKVSTPGTLLEGDQAPNGLTFEPISRIDYTAAMGKAVGKYGEDSPQVRDLNRRRELSMKRGY